MSCMMLRKYCWKNTFETVASALAKLLMTSRHTIQDDEKDGRLRSKRWLTVETSFSNVTHRVLDGPDDTVHEEAKLLRRKA